MPRTSLPTHSDLCEACPSSPSSPPSPTHSKQTTQVSTPTAAFPTPLIRRVTLSSLLPRAWTSRSSEHNFDDVPTTTSDVLTPFIAFPTARSSTSYSGYFTRLPSIRSSFASLKAEQVMEEEMTAFGFDNGGLIEALTGDIGETIVADEQDGTLSIAGNTRSAQSPRPPLRVVTDLQDALTKPTIKDEEHTKLAESEAPSTSAHSVRFLESPVAISPSATHGVEFASDDEPAHSLAGLLKKYDPRCEDIPDLSTIAGHRAAVEQLFIESMLQAISRLHKHYLVINATNPAYNRLQTSERLDSLWKDLSLYVKLIKDFEYWKTSFVQEDLMDDAASSPYTSIYVHILALQDLADASPEMFSAKEREVQYRARTKVSFNTRVKFARSLHLRTKPADEDESSVTLRLVLVLTMSILGIAAICWWKFFSILERAAAVKKMVLFWT